MDTQMKVSDQLKLAFSKINSEEKWTQGAYARNAKGLCVASSDEKAICFCSLGALNVTNTGQWPQQRLLRLEMGMPIEAFNDSHTYEEVAAAWQRAIRKAEIQEEWEKSVRMGVIPRE